MAGRRIDSRTTTFEFDPAKAAANVAKHGVSFELAQAVWDDPLHVILVDRIVDGERRYHAIGLAKTIVLWSSFTCILMERTKIACGSLAPVARHVTKGDDMKRSELDEELVAEAKRLAAMPDSSIDTSDIPEAPVSAWRGAVRPGAGHPRKRAAVR